MKLANLTDDSESKDISFHCLCGGRQYDVIFTYHEPPKGETLFISLMNNYYREIRRCKNCGHFVSEHNMEIDSIYEGNYVSSTYNNNFLSTFQRIINLPEKNSDNVSRVSRIVEFSKRHFGTNAKPSVLDVGSGLCVFLHRLKQITGWECTAFDPDPNQILHARDVVGVEAIQGDFTLPKLNNIGQYDIITFNKVLEHVIDPVGMLKNALDYLNDKGVVYIEVPDGTTAYRFGSEREEFFVEHFHVFSMSSVLILVQKAGFEPLSIERLCEPSGKYTFRVFAKKGE